MECYIPKAHYDLEIRASDITMQLCRSLDMLAPFGLDNPTPAFFLRDVRATG
jgi:single-stranded DNA-specific DHH superfamily exonuclease